MTRAECREVAQGYYDEAELIGYEPTPYEKQLVRAVAAYELDDDDAYNAILARTAQRFHRSQTHPICPPDIQGASLLYAALFSQLGL